MHISDVQLRFQGVDKFNFVFFFQYEFKVKGIRKVRCYLHVSVDGAKVTKRKSKRVCTIVCINSEFHLVHRIFLE